jgi:hypothetical protein
MGTLIYGSTKMAIDFDDRTLAHMQVVFGSKLRRGESFFCSWGDVATAGGGRSSIWVSAGVPIMFHFASTAAHQVDRAWLDTLMESANHPQGLVVGPEGVLANAG